MPEESEPKAGMSVSEITNLVNMFNAMLLSMETRLIAKMDENSRAAAERWERHDEEARRQYRLIEDRFEKDEHALEVVTEKLNEHLSDARDHELVIEARVGPFRDGLTFLASHWKQIVLAVIALAAVLGISTEILMRLKAIF